VEHLAPVPDHALRGKFGSDAEASENLQAALGKADEPRTGADGVALIDQQDIDAPKFQVDGSGKPDRTGADHADRVVPFAPIEIVRPSERIDRVHPARCCRCLHGPVIAADPERIILA